MHAHLQPGSTRRPGAHELWAVAVTVLAGLLAWPFGLDHISYDLLFAFRPEQSPPEAIIVSIDDRSYDSLKQLRHEPWDRSLHARLVDRLRQEGAKVVVVDVMLDEPGHEPQADQALATAIRSHGKVLLAGEEVHTIDVSGVEVRKVRLPLPLFSDAAAGWALSGLEPNPTKRWLHPGNAEHPSLAWKAAALMLGDDSPRLQPRLRDRWLNYYGPHGAFTYVSYQQVLSPDGYPSGIFKNKVVFVGGRTSTGFHGALKDAFSTPFTFWQGSEVPGVEVHATSFVNLLRGDWLRRLPGGLELFLLLGAGAAATFLLARLRPLAAVGAALGMGLLLFALAVALFFGARLWFAWLIVLTVELPVALGSAILIHYLRLHVETKLLEHSLSLHLSPARVRHLLRHPELLKPGGQETTVSILFSDIAGFSRIAGRLTSDDIAAHLNHYYATTLAAIHQNEGTVISLIGDAIFAIWNAPVAQSDHAVRACHAALALRDALVEFDSAQRGLPLRTRIGLHCGTAFVGNIGSETRFEYTAIGESVNLTSRLEGLNKFLGTNVLATRDVQRAVEQSVRSRFLGFFRLNNLDRVVEVHELLGPMQPGSEPPLWVVAFERALHHFHRAEFERAQACFAKVLELRPDDGPAQFYLRRLPALCGQPLPPSWAGEVEIDEK